MFSMFHSKTKPENTIVISRLPATTIEQVDKLFSSLMEMKNLRH